MSTMLPFIAAPDAVLSENEIVKIYNLYSSLFVSSDGSAPPANLATAFTLVVSMVRQPYKERMIEMQSAIHEARNDQTRAEHAVNEARNGQTRAEHALNEARNGQTRAEHALNEARNDQTRTEHALHEARNDQTRTEHTLHEARNDQTRVEHALNEAINGQTRAEHALLAAKNDQARAELELERGVVEMKSVQLSLGLKRATNKRLKKEIKRERVAKQKAEQVANSVKSLLDSKNVMIENSEKVIDTLLKHGLSRVANDEADPLLGSISRTALWQRQREVDGNEFGVQISRLALTDHEDPVTVQAVCDDLLSTKHPKETPMYQPCADLLSQYLGDTDFLVFNTHHHYYLDGFAPDITVSLPGVAVADAMAMVLFVELKAQDGTPLASDYNLGQVYEYLLAAARHQRERIKFIGILSNFKENIAVVLTRKSRHAYLTQYAGCTLFDCLRLVTMVLNDKDFQPPELGFSELVGPMLKRLGRPSNSIVGEFSYLEWFPNSACMTTPTIITSPPRRMAVKRSKFRDSGALDKEVQVLLQIRRSGGHDNLPYIVHLSDDHSEIGTLPIGTPISAATLKIRGLGCKIVDGILDGLIHLHSLGFVHRDVRTANIILNGMTAVLIDFDAAAHAGQPNIHKGGCICAPEEVLNAPNMFYNPKPAHDYLALVLMVNSLLFPHAYLGFHSMRALEHGSAEQVRLIALWEGLRASAVWAGLVLAAKEEKVDVLRAGLHALLVML